MAAADVSRKLSSSLHAIRMTAADVDECSISFSISFMGEDKCLLVVVEYFDERNASKSSEL